MQTEEKPQSPYDNRIFLADKPLDLTSADVVRIFKKEFDIGKIGHSGTLDPKATGLLVLCSGKLTKKITEFIDYDKSYEGVIRIGATTKSFDTETEEENIADVTGIGDEELESARKQFVGEVVQMPPMYSALKHKGKPLYKFARKGREIERKPRNILVEEFGITRISETEIGFRISASKGAYIRCIANDFGAVLGVGGYLKSLRRTRIGKFQIGEFRDSVRNIPFMLVE
ncbi:MAG: tRNA pseudouridine(55) synthase TruB [Ignavibacteria bacterium]|nr:tRNA pseudouridine(55) synthase TruB [Ignavibacteria bacterium]